MPNLLFILQECTSVKGKGLDGKFVYAWEGKDLILLQTDCQEYRNNIKYTELQSKKITTKDLVRGCIYKTNQNEDVIYIGKENVFEWVYYDAVPEKYKVDQPYTVDTIKCPTKKHIFQFLTLKSKWYQEGNYLFLTSLQKIKGKVSDTPVENYAEIFDTYLCHDFGFNATNYTLEPIEIDKLEEKQNGVFKGLFSIESAPGRIKIYYEDHDFLGWDKEKKVQKIRKYLAPKEEIFITEQGEKKITKSRNFNSFIYKYNLKDYGILKVLNPRNEYEVYGYDRYFY